MLPPKAKQVPGSRKQPVTMVVSKSCASSMAVLIRVVTTVTWGHGVALTGASAESNICGFFGPTIIRVSVVGHSL